MGLLLIAFAVIISIMLLIPSRPYYGRYNRHRRYQQPPVVIQTQSDYNRYNRYQPPPVVVHTQPNDYYYRRRVDNENAFIATILFMAMMLFLYFYWGNDAPTKNKERTRQAVHYQIEKE
jgi:hypothetical protein